MISRIVNAVRASQRSAFVALLVAVQPSYSVTIGYTFEDIQKGVTEATAIENARRMGLVVSSDDRGGSHLLADAKTGSIVAQLWVCSGRLYGHSLSESGGATAFAKRVAEFNKEFGAQGRAAATSKMATFGEVNTVEISWQDSWRAVSIVYTPASPGLAESQWVRVSVPKLCARK